MIKKFLNQPYPLLESKWAVIVTISCFIALFMLIFQPFGLSNIQGSYKSLIIAGYGIVTFVVLIINLFIIPFFLKNWFDEKSWTVYKQIIWYTWIIFNIGLGNFVYSNILFPFSSGFNGFIQFQLYTVAIGVFPVVFLTVIKYNLLLKRNLKHVNDLNKNIISAPAKSSKNQSVCLVAENCKDKLQVELSKLIYIESIGNYLKIIYLNNENKLSNTLIRNTLKQAEAQLNEYQSIIKCHRAFIVNIYKIEKVKGNSQGLKLSLKHTDAEIPVSRGLVKSLKEKIINKTRN